MEQKMRDEILSILRKEKDYISGEELSRRLGVTRAAVWKNVKLLRDEGYIIHSITNRGYHLANGSDVLDAAALNRSLDCSMVGKCVEVVHSVDSTNNEVKRRALLGEDEGLVLAADIQTDGKGRLGRNWNSDPGGLYFTVLIRPELPPSDLASITLAAGFAVCTALRDYSGLDAMIKWPNDIIIGNKKVCGILTEIAAQSDRLDYAAIGIGINVNNDKFPEEIRSKATSLYLESGKKTDKTELFGKIINSLDNVLGNFVVSLSIDDFDRFKKLCATLGKEVCAFHGGKTIEGTAVDISASGELIVSDLNGKEYHIGSGEVTVQGIY